MTQRRRVLEGGFVTEVTAWLQAFPDIEARLRGEPPAIMGWIGCSNIDDLVAVARGYPRVSIYVCTDDAELANTAKTALMTSRVSQRVLVRRSDWLATGLNGLIDVVVIDTPVADAASWPPVADALDELLRPHSVALVRTSGFDPSSPAMGNGAGSSRRWAVGLTGIPNVWLLRP